MNHPWRAILATSFPRSTISILMFDNRLQQNILWIGFKLIRLLHYISSPFERRRPWRQYGLITIFPTQPINMNPCINTFSSHAKFSNRIFVTRSLFLLLGFLIGVPLSFKVNVPWCLPIIELNNDLIVKHITISFSIYLTNIIYNGYY